MKWMFTYAFICLLPFSYSSLLATDWLALDGARIASILFVVVGATFLSYILIIVGQKNLRPTVAGMYNYGHLLGYGQLQLDEDAFRRDDFRWCMVGDFQQEPCRNGGL